MVTASLRGVPGSEHIIYSIFVANMQGARRGQGKLATTQCKIGPFKSYDGYIG